MKKTKVLKVEIVIINLRLTFFFFLLSPFLFSSLSALAIAASLVANSTMQWNAVVLVAFVS